MDFIKIVKEICSVKATDCRSLNKIKMARKLMDMVNIPQNAEIQEIPLDWNNQVEILFTVPNDKYYYGLNAGRWLDGTESMFLELIGTQQKQGGHIWFDFYDTGERLPLNYFIEMRQKIMTEERFKEIAYKRCKYECKDISE